MIRVAVACILWVPILSANLLTNGGFERPNLSGSVASETFAAGSTDIPGWLVTDFAPENVTILRSTFVDGSLTFLPEAGDQSLNLTGTISGEAAGVSQGVTLRPGDQYELTFWVGNQDNSVSDYSLDSELSLLLNGNFIGFYANGDSNHHALNWKQFSYVFTATTADNSIAFQNATLSFDLEIGLDSVDLEDITPAAGVPEPAAVCMSGVALLGLVLRRRGNWRQQRNPVRDRH